MTNQTVRQVFGVFFVALPFAILTVLEIKRGGGWWVVFGTWAFIAAILSCIYIGLWLYHLGGTTP
ncbi:MAG: hypothetical protein NUV51_04545 [Sulfuricaulis sp.]|nr:hypothetical protein [Sulfuricaulis sp.]